MDIDRLTGAPWTGTLTYLDYTSHVQTTIKSSLLVLRLPARSDGALAWDMRVGYTDEPHANSGETAVLMPGGRVFRDGIVLEREVLSDGTVRVITETDGEDDGKRARFRFVYLLGEKQCSIQKLVRYTPEEAFFERHIYRWNRESTASIRADSMLRAADLQADVAILRRAYETLHPGLLRYNTPAQVDAAFSALEGEFRQDQTLAQAYLAFSVFAATVKCGHTYPNFFNQSESVAAALFQAPRLPFYFRWLGDRMIVTRSFTADERIRAGAEIVAINDVSVAAILERLMTVARADGNNDAKRVAYLQVEGTSRYEAFDIYWPLFFPSSAPDVTLRVRDPEGNREQTVSVPPGTYADRLAAVEAAEGASADENAPIWSFRLLDDRTGYLRMPSWVLYNSNWNWKASLDETFETLVASGATDLVISLRGNEGGSDVGDVIVSHLITAPVPRQAVSRLVRYRKVPDDLAPYLDTWDPTFKDWGSAAIDSTDCFYRLRRDADDDLGGVITPSLPRFAGRLWVLVGATNSSATFEFAQTIRQNHLGTLVGQPTGGNQRGINGGAFFFLRLPRSGIELDLPLIGQFPDGDRPDAGLQPDIPVIPTVNGIAQGHDAELEAVQTQIHRYRLEKQEK